jgi:hypothetical protein
MGFFNNWKVSGITTDGAKLSEPLTRLGYVLNGYADFNDLDSSEKADIISIGRQYIYMKESLDNYLKVNSKSYHDDAVKFLVMFSALAFGLDGNEWNWQQVRHQSQGLYGSLAEAPSEFDLYNMPLIDNTVRQIEDFTKTHLK